MEHERKETFNLDKLPDYVKDFSAKKAAVIGVGAVGSYLVEMLCKMGVSNIYAFDFDKFEAENTAKSSCLYRFPDDVGKNKAVSIAKRANGILQKESVHGISANITGFGSMAFAGFDIVVLALDNYAAKIYFNQLWKQLPDKIRPVLIFGGTTGEDAQSNCLDGKEPCLRCLLAEEWLDNPLHRTNCTGPQYRMENAKEGIVRTTGLASMISAALMAEQSRNVFLSEKAVLNKRLMYSPYPAIGIREVAPMKRRGCPDCKSYHVVEDAKVLTDMDVMHTTVGELMDFLERDMKTDLFEVMVSRIEFAKITYSGLIEKDYCRSCGCEMRDLYRHEFRTRPGDVICSDCRQKGQSDGVTEGTDKIGTVLKAITRANCTETLKGRTLYEVGFPIGGFIEVITRKEDCVDIMDRGMESRMYYCGKDQELLDKITELEG